MMPTLVAFRTLPPLASGDITHHPLLNPEQD